MLFRASTNPEMWKFKCQNCGDTFDVELTPGQRAVEFARDKTGTTIVTFLVVFLIQYTQNRDAKILQLKIDELIRAVKTARNRMVDLEDVSDEEIERMQKEFQRLAHKRGEEREKMKEKDETEKEKEKKKK